MNYNNNNQYELDYEHLNSLLANPEFASWYFEKMSNKTNEDISISDFVDILISYSNNKLQ